MTETALPRPFRPQSRWVRSVGLMIFFSRWLQAPLYIGLIIAQIIYVIVFMVELINLGGDVWTSLTVPGEDGGIHVEEAAIMLSVLGLIDVVMIANLLIMVIIGGYETFVSRIRLEGHPDQPEWLSHVNANVLKVKLAMAIVGISSIHLLKTFIEVGDLAARGTPVSSDPTETITGNVYTWDGVLWQVIIHMVFILSAIALAWIDRMSQSGHTSPAPALLPGLAPVVAPEPVAALAAAPARRELEGHAPAASTGIALHLTQLGQLRDAGVVTDAEFLAKKTELLARY